MVLEFFGSFEEAKVYYSGDLIFGLSIYFDWWARRLYVSGIRIISGGGFKKVDIKKKAYIKITQEI